MSISIVSAELVLRICLDEVNYLRPTLLPHSHLRHSIAPHSAGHDAWGFRNLELPEQADIIAIGDSQTYGVSAMASQSWPAWLTTLSGEPVYNLGLGGYGLLDYLWLLENKAPLLKPKEVLIGLYLGNDLAIHKGMQPDEQMLKERNNSNILLKSQQYSKKNHAFKNIRESLSRTSMLYQVSKFTFGHLTNRMLYKTRSAQQSDIIPLNSMHLRTLLTPQRYLHMLDLERAKNRANLEKALNLIDRLMQRCKEQRFNCTFIVIPTKESVYWPLAKKIISGSQLLLLEKQVRMEARVLTKISHLFDSKKQSYIDTLPALQLASQTQSLYPESDDSHPNARGYKVIADSIRVRFPFTQNSAK